MNTLESLLGSYFREPDDNPNFYLADDAMRAAAVGADVAVDPCAICDEREAGETGLCQTCLDAEIEAMEREVSDVE